MSDCAQKSFSGGLGYKNHKYHGHPLPARLFKLNPQTVEELLSWFII